LHGRGLCFRAGRRRRRGYRNGRCWDGDGIGDNLRFFGVHSSNICLRRLGRLLGGRF
jgi:hypothetical protein